MKNGKLVIVSCISVLLVVLLSTAFAQKNYPAPESYLKQNDPESFALEAMDFLAEHPDSHMAPRVAFDLYMVAAVFQHSLYEAKMEEVLALDYPQSLQGNYFRSTFSDADAYRGLLSRLLDDFASDPQADFIPRFVHGLGYALDDFGDLLLSDPDFVLKSAYMLKAAGETDAQKSFLNTLEPMLTRNAELAEISAIAADDQKSVQDKILALHDKSSQHSALFLRNLFLFSLSDDELETAAMRQVVAEALIEARRFSDALLLLEKQSLDHNGDQILFQRAWCQAAMHQRDQALSSIARIGKDYPDSPWLNQALVLQQAVQQYDARLETYTSALLKLTDTISDLDALEVSVLYTPEGYNTVAALYMAMNMVDHFFESQLRVNNNLEFAYKSSPQESLLFVRGNDTIHHALEPGPLPSLNLDLFQDRNDKFQFNLALNLVNDFQDMALSNQSFLESPFLTTQEGAHELLNYTITSGYLPGQIETDDYGTVFNLHMPDARTPKGMSTSKFILNKAGKLEGLEISGVKIQKINYGDAASLSFSPPEWPDLDKVTSREFNAGYFFNVFGNILQLLADPDDN